MNYIKTFEDFNNNGLLKIDNKSELLKILKSNTFRLFNEEIKKDDSRLDFDKYNYFGLFDSDKCVALLSYTENHWSLNSNNYKGWVYLDTLESIKQGSGKIIMNDVIDYLQNNNYRGIILRPICDELIKYYKSFGFTTYTNPKISSIKLMKKIL